MAADAEWLSDLARSRQAPGHGAQPLTVLERDEDPQGRARWTLTMPAPEERSRVVAEALLAAFVESTAPGARAAEQKGLLPRGIEVTTPGIPPASRAPTKGGQLAPAAAPQMQVCFVATDPAAERLVEKAATHFEVRQGAAGGNAGSGHSTCLVGTAATSCCLPHLLLPSPSAAQAYWQYHIKAAKADLHCRMRSRLSALQQQLMLTKYDGL